MFHPAAALRSTDVERQSYDDIAGLPRVLTLARERRRAARSAAATQSEASPPPDAVTPPDQMTPPDQGDDAPTLF